MWQKEKALGRIVGSVAKRESARSHCRECGKKRERPPKKAAATGSIVDGEVPADVFLMGGGEDFFEFAEFGKEGRVGYGVFCFEMIG